jgi:integrase
MANVKSSFDHVSEMLGRLSFSRFTPRVVVLRRRDTLQSDGYLPNSFCSFTRHTNFTKRQWKPLLEKAEVEDFGWHALRHFAVSTWIEAGPQPKAIQKLVGIRHTPSR